VVDTPDCVVLDAPLRHAFARLRALTEVLPAHGEVHGISDGARAVLGVAASSDALGQRVPLPPLRGDATSALTRCSTRCWSGSLAPGLAVGVTTLAIDGAGLEDMSIRTGPFAFAQAQAAQNAALVAEVLDAAGRGYRRGLELYAGSGNFTRVLAPLCRTLEAVELDPGGANNLQAMAARLGVRGGRVQVRRESATSTLARAAAAGERFDLVVLDPPRGGLGLKAAKDLAKVASGRVIYVSCDPATLARDLAVLTEGRRIGRVTVFDMMPMTPEVEVVVSLV
jgi:23S rRNA (uracil1939-C5)-methyltransferase